MANFYTLFLAYSKAGQLYKLQYMYLLVLGFGKRVTLQFRRLSPLIKELNMTFLLKLVIDSATLIETHQEIR